MPPEWWRTTIAEAIKALGSNSAATDLKRLARLTAVHDERWVATLAMPTALAQWEAPGRAGGARIARAARRYREWGP
ncbi:hypothetical protein GCM10010353_62870 [Streptomyces chryseus]|nr:hypothetical protein GCM10010353_62870 [Streptomyces chryseus]